MHEEIYERKYVYHVLTGNVARMEGILNLYELHLIDKKLTHGTCFQEIFNIKKDIELFFSGNIYLGAVKLLSEVLNDILSSWLVNILPDDVFIIQFREIVKHIKEQITIYVNLKRRES